ncbi:MAG: hypothetical protein IJ122_06430 [Methanobrevibacter sp.]|nr:hypothetical protein [Methanobrevibacter sp.]
MRLTKLQAKTKRKYYIVYKLTNSQDKKSYIGAHKIIFGRENDGYICSSKLVFALVKKNPELFSKTILARYSTAREADRAEKRFISQYDTYKHGYNRSRDGGHYTCYGNKKYGKIKMKRRKT